MKRFKARQIYLLFILILSGFLITGCGSGGGEVTEHWAPARQLMSIEVTPPNPIIATATTQRFMATGIYSENTHFDLTSSVTWSSSNTDVATINTVTGSIDKGVATSKAPGTTRITATDTATGISGYTTLTVKSYSVTLTSIEVTPVNPIRPLGINPQFTATGTFSDNTTQNITSSVTWSSLHESIATFNNLTGPKGLATTLAEGVTTIKATDSTGIFGTTNLTVTAATLVSIEVTPPDAKIPLGLKQQFIAMGTYTDGTKQNLTSLVTWSTPLLATPIASISNAADGSNGLATSLHVGGPIRIHVIDPATGIFGNAKLTVTEATLVSIAVDPASAIIFLGTNQPFIATGTYTDGTTQPLTQSVTWSTPLLTTPVASISNAEGSKGLATALTVGGPIRIHVIDPATLKFGNAKLTVKSALPPASCAGPGPVDMGAADSFGVLVGPAGGATLTVTNPTSVTGDTGAASYVPDVGPSTLVGTKYTGVDTPYVNAKAAMLTAISCASARACSAGSAFNFSGDHDFGGDTLEPGVYCVTGAMSVGSNLTLSTPGVYIFRSTGALTSVNTITMAFGGTANATNTSVFWVPTGAASIGSDNAFLGTIMPGASAATTLGANTTLLPGRVLSNSDVTLDSNTIAKPTY